MVTQHLPPPQSDQKNVVWFENFIELMTFSNIRVVIYTDTFLG